MSSDWVVESQMVYQMRCAKCHNYAGPPLRSEKAVEQWLHMREKPCRYCESAAPGAFGVTGEAGK